MNTISRGFTLIELVATVAIGAIIATAAVPMISDYNTNSRLREAGNAMLAQALFAQSEAIKRNSNVSLQIGSSIVRVIDVETGATLGEKDLPARVLATPGDVTFGARGWPTPLGTVATVDFSMPDQSCSTQYRCPRLLVEAGGTVRLFGNKLDPANL